MWPDALEQSARASRRELLILSGGGRGCEMNQFPDKLGAVSEAVRVFDANALPYALIGGLAVGVHTGVPRATLDVDFAVNSASDLEQLRRAFAQAGFTCIGSFPHSLNFRHESGEPVQLAFDAEFDAMVDAAETIRVGELELRIVRKTDLIRMKQRAAGDPSRRKSKALRDLADIALLEGDVPSDDEGW
jgi:hypothetical protein